MKLKFNTDFEYDEWYEKKREEQMLEQFGEKKEEVKDGEDFN